MTSSAYRFAHVWARALVVPVVLFLVVTAYLVVVAGLGAADDEPVGTAADPATSWRASYSRRFPDCVALVLWPRHERPAGVLVRAHGTLAVMTLREAVVRLRLADSPHEVELVGACR
jgi:hypothetical protein